MLSFAWMHESYPWPHRSLSGVPVQELVRTTRDALPAGEFAALRGATLRLMEARSRTMAEDGSTRCLYCIHIVFNMAGARTAGVPTGHVL